MLAEKAASAKDLYGKALAEGQGKVMPQAVRDFLGSPDIAPIVADLQATRPYANVSAESPEMLDAVYKNLSDQSGALKSKLSALIPRKANLGRVAAQDVGMAKDEALNAMSRGPDAPMPGYETAVQDFANRSRGIDSFDTGYDALRSALSPAQVSAKNLNRANKTPEGFADWIGGLTSHAGDAANATSGILGYARGEPVGKLGLRLPKTLGTASGLLRSADEATGTEKYRNALQYALAALQGQASP